MAKAPAFQFYARDWLCDPELSQVSHTVKGVWIDMLCWMWLADERGVLNGTQTDLCKLLRVHHRTFKNVVKNAQVHPFCTYTYAPQTGIHRFENRRMVAERLKKRGHSERQKRYIDRRNDATNDAGVTPPSATASASASASASRDVSLEVIPDGPKGWIAAACTFTGRPLPEMGTQFRKDCVRLAEACFKRHGDKANDVLSKLYTEHPEIIYPSKLLAMAAGGGGGVTETLDEKAKRLAGEEGA